MSFDGSLRRSKVTSGVNALHWEFARVHPLPWSLTAAVVSACHVSVQGSGLKFISSVAFPFLIMIVLLASIIPGFGISVHQGVAPYGTADQPLQVWFHSPRFISSPPCAYLLNVYAKTSSDLTITSVHWDFGDGSTLDVAYSARSYISDASFHIYQSTGTFTVTVTAYDSGGNSGTSSLTLANVTPGSCTAGLLLLPSPPSISNAMVNQ